MGIKISGWKLSPQQIKLLIMISETDDLSIENRRKYKVCQKDESNFIKAIKKLKNKGLISITPKKMITKNGINLKNVKCYRLTKEGNMFLKILRNTKWI